MENSPKLSTPESVEAAELEVLRLRLMADSTPEVVDEVWRHVEPRLRQTAAAEAFRKRPRNMDMAHVVDEALDRVRLDLVRLAPLAERNFAAYLRATVRNKVADLIRRYVSSTKLEVTGEQAERAQEVAVDQGLSPEEILIAQEQAREQELKVRMLLEAIDFIETTRKFGPRQMTAVQLQVCEELPVQKIAERLGMSKKTAEDALRLGFAALRKVLTEKYGLREPGMLTPFDGEC